MAGERSTDKQVTTLNYSYRLYPNSAQAYHLGHAMFFMRLGWNDMVRYTRNVRSNPSRWSAARAQLAKWVADKKPVGARAGKLNMLIASGLTKAEATAQLNREQTDLVWKQHSSAMQVAYGKAKADRCRVRSAGSAGGTVWKQLEKKWDDSWTQVWKKKRRPPRHKKAKQATWIQCQIQGKQLLCGRRDGHNINRIDLSIFFPPRLRHLTDLTSVKVLEDRRLPVDAAVKDIKITRTSIHPHAKWHAVLALDLPKNHPLVQKKHQSTGLACGIDPGVETAFTVAGEDAQPGIEGFEIDPGRPFHKARKKLAKLQRRYDRQERANNPHCFSESGERKRGEKIKVRSQNMVDTLEAIADLHQRAADIRKDYYNKAAIEVLNKYDTVYVGNWSDATPAQKGAQKRKRKSTFKTHGKKRKKGVAAAEKARNRVMRDHAPGLFRSILKERAARSVMPKQVEEVSEYQTTRRCVHCQQTSDGPTGIKDLGKREWTCSCGTYQLRDRAAAWNILQVGRSQAAGQAVTGTPKKAVARSSGRMSGKGAPAASRSRTGASKRSGARSNVERVFTQTASGEPVVNDSEALASPQIVRQVDVAVGTEAQYCASQRKPRSRSRRRVKRSRRSVTCKDGSGSG